MSALCGGGPLPRLLLWVAASAAFGGALTLARGREAGAQYFAGYLVEQSLSVDNLCVFSLIFRFFRTPAAAQDKALAWGILGAGVMRGVCILLGAALLERFTWLLGACALVLLWSAWKLLMEGDDDDAGDLSDNWAVRLCRRVIPVTERYEGERFISAQRTASGGTRFTPLLLVVAVIEISDVVFAVDSIPAVFGVTTDPLRRWWCTRATCSPSCRYERSTRWSTTPWRRRGSCSPRWQLCCSSSASRCCSRWRGWSRCLWARRSRWSRAC